MPESKPQNEAKTPTPGVKAETPKAVSTAGEKKPDAPAKTTDSKAASAPGDKKSEPLGKATDPKTTPAPSEKKPDTPAKATDSKATPAPGEKKPETPAKATDPKIAPTPDEKKPEAPAKTTDPKAAPAPDEKKPEAPAKATDPKTAPAPDEKKPEAPAKAPDPKAAPAPGEKKPEAPEKAADPKPKEGEGISMRLHPGYFFEFLDHPFSVNRETQDYKELFDSIKENGVNEPVKARPREGGGLELISGHRRHDVAQQLNYPVPVVIVQMDDDSARIEVVDGNLHRRDIPTSELARAAKMKLEALGRKAGRRSKMEQLANGPQKRTDQIVAEDMGMSRNQVQRLVRIDSLIPDLKKQVDDKTLPFNTAVELSHLNPEEQHAVADYITKEQRVPSMAQAQELKTKSQEAAKAAKAGKSAGAISSHNFKPSLPSSLKVDNPAPTPTEKKDPAPVTDKTIASIMKPKKNPKSKSHSLVMNCAAILTADSQLCRKQSELCSRLWICGKRCWKNRHRKQVFPLPPDKGVLP